jgi:hypothetical protein
MSSLNVLPAHCWPQARQQGPWRGGGVCTAGIFQLLVLLLMSPLNVLPADRWPQARQQGPWRGGGVCTAGIL